LRKIIAIVTCFVDVRKPPDVVAVEIYAVTPVCGKLAVKIQAGGCSLS